jgi:DNA-binding PadR family transcriptional regulator
MTIYRERSPKGRRAFVANHVKEHRMGHQDFNRQWARFVDQQWGQHGRRGWEGGHGWGGEWGGGHKGGPHRGGPPPWVAGLFGLAQGEQSRGPRVRRGDVRAAILDVLQHEPMNGYQIIGQIAERSTGAWRPSPGSVYPTLQQLEDEGLVEADEERGRRTFRLTEEGQTYVDENAAELAEVWAPFESPREEERADFRSLKPEIGQVMNAVWQIITTGTEAQRREAIDVLIETRRKLYGILAEGDPE